MILPATRTWTNRFVALSALSTRLRLLQNHPPNFLSDIFKCDLQNTQTAPLAVVCTPTIKLVQQNHQKLETRNVCEKNLHSVFLLSFFSSFTVPLILFFISLSLLLGITEFCYAFLACVRTLLCFSEKAYLQNQQWGT